jgi:hypothetical protein
MTIAQHISLVKSLLRSYTDDTNYTDEFIYALLNSYRAQVLKEYFKNNTNISHFNWQLVCVSLVKSTIHDDCPCAPEDDCKILRTAIKIPVPITVSSIPMLKVRTFNGQTIPFLSLEKAINKHLYKHLKNKIVYSISNGYLFIFGTNSLKAIIIDGVFEDPTELSDITMCDEGGGSTSVVCFNILTADYPLDLFLEPLVRKLILDDLTKSLSIPKDVVNDTQSAT